VDYYFMGRVDLDAVSGSAPNLDMFFALSQGSKSTVIRVEYYPRALSQGSKSTVIRVEYFVRDRNYAYGVHI
jgi:hypothetical protein